MEACGVDLMEGLDRMAVMGFTEVVGRLPFFWRLERRVRRRLDRGEIDLVIPIDYPGFNRRVARAAHDRGVPVLYYIAPQVWAWRAGRARLLARHTDRVAVVLPFESEILTEAGAQAEFVGHPLVEGTEPAPDRAPFMSDLGLDPERPLLALFPGSRPQEIDRHLELFEEASQTIRRHREDVQVALARARGLEDGRLEATGLPVSDHGRSLLHHATAALVKSGTTTLEAALEGTPMVVAYRTSPVTFLLARHLVSVPYVSLVNLVAGEEVVPEFLQGAATPDALAGAVLPLLNDTARRRRMVHGLRSVRQALGDPGAAGRVAEMAEELLAGSARG